jgi:two-component system chemotaxis response regulator CheY
MKILIVDDSKHVHSIVTGMLEKVNYQSASAYHGLDAVEQLKGGLEVDLVLLDWNMPEMNGPEFLKAVKNQQLTSAPIVMMTTENSIEKITEAMGLGAQEYIMKPFTDDILLSKVDFVLGMKAA